MCVGIMSLPKPSKIEQIMFKKVIMIGSSDHHS
uniref:Uncharacterized protein n=1 Tax=Arundo donax TaxID=35708 RepID=A0A0A9FUT9_ARUDO